MITNGNTPDGGDRPDDALLESCELITTTPNALMRPIHDRMPALLSTDTCEAWLAPHAPPEAAPTSSSPRPMARIAHRVGVRVNRLVHDDVACLAEVAPPAEQLGLGL